MNLILGLGFCSPSSSPGPGYTNFFFLMPSCCSVTKCNPMDWSTPSFPVLHHLLELAQTPLSQWYHPTILSSVVPLSSYPQSFPTSGSFPMSWLFASGGQSIGASASALLMVLQNFYTTFPQHNICKTSAMRHLSQRGSVFLKSSSERWKAFMLNEKLLC